MSISAVGIGKVELAVAPESNITLNNVLYVPQASVRLISVKALALQNLNTLFTGTGCKITNSISIIIATSGLYTLNTQSTPDHALIATPSLILKPGTNALGTSMSAQSLI